MPVWSEGYLADNLHEKSVMGLQNEWLLQQLLTQDHTKSLDNLFRLLRFVIVRLLRFVINTVQRILSARS